MNLKSIKGWTIIFLWAGMLAFIGCPGDEEDVVQEKQKKEVAKKLVSKDKAETKKTKSKKSKSDAGSVVDLKLKSDAGPIIDKIAKSSSRSLVDRRARSGVVSVKKPVSVFVKVIDPMGKMAGSGTEKDPYQIAHPGHLSIEVRKKLKAHYQVVKNLDLSGIVNFIPIGNEGLNSKFSGIFDGKGKTIKGLKINRSRQNYVGLFGATTKSVIIKDMKLIDVKVTGKSYVGGLAGYFAGKSIKNVQVSGLVSGKNNVGGLVGTYADSNPKGLISGSRADVVVRGFSAKNPLDDPNIEACSYPKMLYLASGDIEEYSYAVGGLVGLASNVDIEKSEATGSVTGYYCGVGGLVGLNASGIKDSRASGVVKGEDKHVGVLVGLKEDSSKIDDKSEGTGTVTAIEVEEEEEESEY